VEISRTYSCDRMIIYVNVITKRRFSPKNFDAKFEELGKRGSSLLKRLRDGSKSRGNFTITDIKKG